MTKESAYRLELANSIGNRKVTFNDEKNRSKLIGFLDRVGQYSGYDKDMKIRIFTDMENDFCAFEAVEYRLSFLSTAHKLDDMMNECRMTESTIGQLRSMLASS